MTWGSAVAAGTCASAAPGDPVDALGSSGAAAVSGLLCSPLSGGSGACSCSADGSRVSERQPAAGQSAAAGHRAPESLADLDSLAEPDGGAEPDRGAGGASLKVSWAGGRQAAAPGH